MPETNTLLDMTQAKWDSMSRIERERIRDNSGLSPQLIGLEGWRVEVTESGRDKPRRFIVGKSTGWRPCHLEISRVDAHGGGPARQSYLTVKPVSRARQSYLTVKPVSRVR